MIDGSLVCPAKFLEPSTVDGPRLPNPAFDDWIARDQALMTLINAILSQVALAYVVGSETSRQIWETLEKHY